MGSTFLRADWKNLVLFNFKVPDEVLEPYLPPRCELDRYEGSAYLSLVAFQFLNTRVLGIRWPGYVNFPEINLRFYVRCEGQRGVVFIREFVPSRVVAALARVFYNEPYRTGKMGHEVLSVEGQTTAKYQLSIPGAQLKLEVQGDAHPRVPPTDSLEHFFKEHSFGFGKARSGDLVRYEVHHPQWETLPVSKFRLEADWADLYGNDFAFLGSQDPRSVVFALGSEIRVEWKSP